MILGSMSKVPKPCVRQHQKRKKCFVCTTVRSQQLTWRCKSRRREISNLLDWNAYSNNSNKSKAKKEDRVQKMLLKVSAAQGRGAVQQALGKVGLKLMWRSRLKIMKWELFLLRRKQRSRKDELCQSTEYTQKKNFVFLLKEGGERRKGAANK